MTKSEIELKADNVLNKYVLRGGAYKQFKNIFECENVKYKEIEDNHENFAGVFTKAPNGQKYIMINSSMDNIGRKNFTIAHELGHYFLNHKLNSGKIIDKQINEECSNKEPIEYEADYFATCLLMPEQKIISAFKSMLRSSRKIYNKEFLNVNTMSNYGVWCGIRDDLTKRYGVSETALRYRLVSLHLASFDFYY